MNKQIESLQHCCEKSYDNLYYLESILKITKESYLYKGLINLDTENLNLDEEYNIYINMLNIALDKIENIKEHINHLEEELYLLN